MEEVPFQIVFNSELIIGVFVTIRKYPKRYFVAYEDYRNDRSGGSDIKDTYNAPIVIWKKISHENFELATVLKELTDYFRI